MHRGCGVRRPVYTTDQTPGYPLYINAQFGLAQPITSVNCSQKGVIPCADADSIYLYIRGPGWLVGKSAGLVIERLRVRIPAEAA